MQKLNQPMAHQYSQTLFAIRRFIGHTYTDCEIASPTNLGFWTYPRYSFPVLIEPF